METKSPPVISSLADLIEKEKEGVVCATIVKIGEPRVALVSKWKYRELSIRDGSMESRLQIGDDRFVELKAKVGDIVLIHVKSRGVDTQGTHTVMFKREVTTRESASIVAILLQELSTQKLARKKIKHGPTVWPFHSREARGLIRLVGSYLKEGRPQHYHKFSLDQFVAEDLYGAGWAKRIGRGLYVPSEEAIAKIRSNSTFPSSRIRVITQMSVTYEDSPNATYMTVGEYLNAESDAESAKEEHKSAMEAIGQYGKSEK